VHFRLDDLQQVKYSSAIDIFKMAVAAVRCISVWMTCNTSNILAPLIFFLNGCGSCPVHSRLIDLQQVKYSSAIDIFKMAVAAVPCISVWMTCNKSNILAPSIFSKWLWQLSRAFPFG